MAGTRQTEEGQATRACSSDGAGKGDSSRKSRHPAGGKAGAGAAAAACMGFVRRWPAVMQKLKPLEDACGLLSAAASRAAELSKAAAGQAAAARERTYPLPQHTTLDHVLASVSAGIRSARVAVRACDQERDSLSSVLMEMDPLRASCVGLINAAHSAGLAWLSAGEGPGLEAGQAWCAEFLEVCAGLYHANVQVEVCKPALVLVREMEDASAEVVTELAGGASLAAFPAGARQCKADTWWCVLLEESAMCCVPFQSLLCWHACVEDCYLLHCPRAGKLGSDPVQEVSKRLLMCAECPAVQH